MRNAVVVPSDTRVLPSAHPLTLPGDSHLPAVLLLHGYTGYPGDLRYLATRVNERGFHVVVPRYPGHGTNSRDFRSTTWRDWQRRGVDAYLELAGRHDRVIVGGLSMGGLISTLIASNFPVDRLVLLAPAFRTINRLVALTPALRYVVPPLKNSNPETYDDAERQKLADEYWNWQWPAETASLYRLMRAASKALPKVSAPTLSVVSTADETVPPSVAELVDRRIGSEKHHIERLHQSGHVITNDTERERVADIVVDWIAREKD